MTRAIRRLFNLLNALFLGRRYSAKEAAEIAQRNRSRL